MDVAVSVEQNTSPERESRYDQVVFGHSFEDFDRDQFLTYYLAIKAGLVTPNAPVVFTPKVTDEMAGNDSVMIIEGLPSKYRKDKSFNTLESGNFDNAENDDPAAYALYEKIQSKLGKEIPEFATQANDLARWLRWAETHKKLKKPLVNFRAKHLRAFMNGVLHGYRKDCLAQGTSPDECAQGLIQMFDEFVASDNRAALLSGKLMEYRKIAQTERSAAQAELRGHVKQPGMFEYVTTNTKKRLAYFDIRGLSADTGAIRTMLDYTMSQGLPTPDLCLLIADSIDSQGKTTSKILLKIPDKRDHSEDEAVDIVDMDMSDQGLDDTIVGDNPSEQLPAKQDLRTLLGDRLTYVESLFGYGYTAEIGGHDEVLVSDRLLGSGLEPEKLWFALCRFFNTDRYTHEQFADIAKNFATKLVGVEQVYTDSHLESDTPGRLPDRSFKITVPDPDGAGTEKTVDIKESDLPIYEQVFHVVCNNNQEHFRKILSQQTDITYAPEVLEWKRKLVMQDIASVLKQNAAAVLLDAVADLNQDSLRNLPLPTRLQIIHTIANSNEGIDCIWNPDNKTYRISIQSVPVKIRDLPEVAKYNKFAYESVSQLIDRRLMDSLVSDFDMLSYTDASVLLNDLAHILDSESYRMSHSAGVWYDRLIQSFAALCIKGVSRGFLDQPAGANLIQSLLEKYPGSTERIRSTLGYSEMVQLSDILPDEFPLDSIGPAAGYELRLPSNPDARIIRPSAEVIASAFAVQESQESIANEPIMTMVLRFGQNFAKSVEAWEKGVKRANGEWETDMVTVSEVIVPVAIDLETSAEAIQITQSIGILIRDILDRVDKTNPDTKIRIVTSGIPNIIATWIGSWAGRHGIADRLITCNYNMQIGQYQDFPVTLPEL